MKTNSRGTVSVILVLAIIALVGYFVISSINLRMDIKDKSEQVSDLTEQISAQNEENSELNRVLSDESESDYLEQYAREELDYVMPGERVYADSAN